MHYIGTVLTHTIPLYISIPIIIIFYGYENTKIKLLHKDYKRLEICVKKSITFLWPTLILQRIFS